MVFYFIEEDRQRYAHLRTRLAAANEYRKFNIVVKRNDFASVISEVLDHLDEGRLQIAPTFAFIDPFGFKGLPMRLIHRLLDHPKTEAFINFNINSVTRFVSHPDKDIRSHLDDLFGTEEAMAVRDGESNRFSSLRQVYQAQLEEKARFVRFFSMNDADDRPIYDLFFAGNHPLGHYRMKEAMWRVDPQSGIRFSDATDPDQQLLFEIEPGPQLLQRLLKMYGDRSEVLVGEVKEWVRNETAFLNPHLTDALRQGEGIHFGIQDLHSDGSKRRAGSFKDVAVVDFTWRPPPEYLQGTLF